MWPFKKKTPVAPHNPNVFGLLKDLNERLLVLEHHMTTLKTQHQSLSGRYYARFGKGPPHEEGVDAERTLSKAERMLKLGIVPGRPVPKLEKGD